MHEIKDNGTYLLIKLTGEFDFHALIEVIDEEMALPVYPERNDIWDMRQASLALQFEQLSRIWEHVLQKYPTNPRRNRVALLVNPGLNSSYAEMWATTAPPQSPFVARVYEDWDLAVAWVSP